MAKRRVVLLSAHRLLGESLELILSQVEDLELLGSWVISPQVISHLSGCDPEIIVIAEGEDQHAHVSDLTANILEQFPHLPVIRCAMEHNVLRIYSTQVLPARSTNLIEAIRSWPLQPNHDVTKSPAEG